MTTTYQVSAKSFDGTIYVIKSESDEPEIAWTDFGSALNQIANGLAAQTLAGMQTLLGAAPLAAATGAVQAAIPSQVTQVPAESWGNPPVQPYQPPVQQQPQYQQAPQMPAAGAPTCQHGQKKLVRGNGKKGAWAAWGCPAGQNDPTKCNPGLDFDAARGL